MRQSYYAVRQKIAIFATKKQSNVIPDKETAQFIKEHRNDDVRILALQAARYPAIDIRAAATQIEGWQLAKSKLPAWSKVEGIVYPVRLSMEQCSSEETAQYKASLITGDTLADLTGGFGIDCSYMSAGRIKSIYIERNEELCAIASHNFSLLGLKQIEIINGNSQDILPSLPHCSWIFIDPARRSESGHKVVALGDCEPDVTILQDILLKRADNIMIKCSPMLDITAACRSLRQVSEVHIVAVNNECKELLFILSHENKGTKITCVNITGGVRQQFSYDISEESRNSVRLSQNIGKYLYEPNAAIQKAGAGSILSSRYNIDKLHPNSQLYTSQEHIPEFPGRRFIVEEVAGFAKKELKALLNNAEQANITVRNFPESVQTLRKRLKIAEGGDIYLFATTLADNSKVIVKCRKA